MFTRVYVFSIILSCLFVRYTGRPIHNDLMCTTIFFILLIHGGQLPEQIRNRRSYFWCRGLYMMLTRGGFLRFFSQLLNTFLFTTCKTSICAHCAMPRCLTNIRIWICEILKPGWQRAPKLTANVFYIIKIAFQSFTISEAAAPIQQPMITLRNRPSVMST